MLCQYRPLVVFRLVPVTTPQPSNAGCDFDVSNDQNVWMTLGPVTCKGAKAALAQIYNAEDRDHALMAVKAFEAD